MIKVALNGYGRIGRVFHRIALLNSNVEVVVISSRADAASHAHLLKHDSVYGKCQNEIACPDEKCIQVDGKRIPVIIDKSPGEVNWKDFEVDIVVEATGKFKDRVSCKKQLEAGAKKVIISAPGEEEDVSLVMGVNHEEYSPKEHDIISNASCTTNALSLIMKVLLAEFGVESTNVTTIHALTKTQNILDGSHCKNMRIARAAGESYIPSSTGASKAIVKIFPELEGKIFAKSVRVPVPTVSMLDINVNLDKSTNKNELNNTLEKYANGQMKGFLGFSKEPLVSIDYVGEKQTSVIDSLLTDVIEGKHASIVAWYDNEWGYAERLYDLVKMVGRSL